MKTLLKAATLAASAYAFIWLFVLACVAMGIEP